jgi:mannose-1-phosphate guanylyltransferase
MLRKISLPPDAQVIGLSSSIGKWCFVTESVLGESVDVTEALLLNGATVLPHKKLRTSIRSPEIII